MVVTSLSLTVEGPRRERVVRALRALAAPTSVEPGCIASRVLEEAGNPSHLFYLEQWETTEQFTAQLKSKRYRTVLEAMEESVTPPELQFYWVSEAKGIEYLEAIRLQQCP